MSSLNPKLKNVDRVKRQIKNYVNNLDYVTLAEEISDGKIIIPVEQLDIKSKHKVCSYSSFCECRDYEFCFEGIADYLSKDIV